MRTIYFFLLFLTISMLIVNDVSAQFMWILYKNENPLSIVNALCISSTVKDDKITVFERNEFCASTDPTQLKYVENRCVEYVKSKPRLIVREFDPGVNCYDIKQIRKYTDRYYHYLINGISKIGFSFLFSKFNHSLDKLPLYGNELVYRGSPHSFPKNYKNGDIIKYPMFLSTTPQLEVAIQFGLNIYFFRNAHNGIFINNISRFDDEQEVLFKPDTKLKIIGTPYSEKINIKNKQYSIKHLDVEIIQ